MTNSVGTDVRTHLLRRAVAQHWTAIVILTALFTLAGVALAIRGASYTASADVLIKPAVGNAYSPDTLSNSQQVTVGLETESHLINDPQVVALIPGHTRSLLDSGRASVDSTVVLNSQILRVAFTAPTKSEASVGANAAARALLMFRQNQATTLRDNQVNSLNKQIDSTTKALGVASKAANTAGSSAGAQTQVQLLAGRLASLQSALSTTEAVATEPGKIVSDAQVNQGITVVAKKLLRPVSLFLLGLILGLALAVWRVFHRDAIDSEDDLQVAGVPIWSSLPTNQEVAEEQLFSDVTDIRTRETYRRLRVALLAGARRPLTLAVTGREPTPGLGQVAANLAVSLASADYRVVLVDAEVDTPQVHELLSLSPGPGVSDALLSGEAVHLRRLHEHGVDVVTAGTSPHQALDLFAGRGFSDLMASLREEYDYVLIVSPPLSTATGVGLAAIAEATLLVVVESTTGHDDIAELVDRTRPRGVDLVGLVTVRNSRRSPRSRRGRRRSGSRAKSKSVRRAGKAVQPVSTSAFFESQASETTPVLAVNRTSFVQPEWHEPGFGEPPSDVDWKSDRPDR